MRRRTVCGNSNIVGNRIREIRLKQGVGPGELVAKLQLLNTDISQSTLSRIEGQQIVVSDSNLFALARALEVSVADFFPSLPKISTGMVTTITESGTVEHLT